tara:strand:- start:266 stop:559 length:294 start_codon:yes stop_codon:yes gene_type:complete
MTFYHGTSSLTPIQDKLLPPDAHSFGINEEGRTKHAQKVFFTTIKDYASTYARNCCRRVGGVPIIYEVLATNPKLMVKCKGLDIYYDKEATVMEKCL